MTHVSPAVAWFAGAVLIAAAIIDGRTLKVPNWLTFPFALAGLAFAAWAGGPRALLGSAEGLALGLGLLLPLYAVGGMGAGDVKLMAGLGAWIGPAPTLGAFAATAVVGGLMALAMIARSGCIRRHFGLIRTIGTEILVLRDPVQLSEIAAARKPTMLLLPYGIPIAIGSLAYFAWAGMLGS